MIRSPASTSFGLLALLSLPTAALAKGTTPAAPASHTTIVFVGAEDKGAESSALKLGGMVEEAVGRTEHYTLTSLRDAAGERVPADARASLQNGEDDLAAGKKAFADGKIEDAESNLNSAVKAFEGAAAGLEKPDAYADANAYLAAVFQQKHKDDDAKDALAQVLAVAPNYRLDAKLGGGPVAEIFRQVRHEVGEGHHGTAAFFSTPAGGKVFVDGELKGYTPVTVDRLPVGRHLIRFERPGYLNAGQTTNITSTEEGSVKAHFTATKDFSDVEDQVGQAMKEVDTVACGPASFRLLKHYSVDRAIFANVRTTGDNLVLDLSLVDLSAHKRVAHRRNSFEGEDSQNLTREVNHLVSGLLSDADERPAAKGTAVKDPLEGVSGTEDWDDDKGSSKSKSTDDEPRKKKSSDDD